MKYKINEIFYSIQGEGFHSGTACLFIRLSGCNLKCSFCDTNHEKYTEMESLEIKNKLQELSTLCKTVVITGGEPCLVDLTCLINELNRLIYIIHVESNGTFKRPDAIDWFTISPKQPDYKIITKYPNEIKYVVDESFDSKVISEDFNWAPIYLQPEGNKLKNIKKCVKLIKENPEWKLSLQMHKLINIA